MATDYNALLGQMINSPFATPSDRERMVALLLREHDSKFVTKEQMKDVMAMAEMMKKDFFESKERQIKDFIEAHPAKGNDAFPEPKQTYEFLYSFTNSNGDGLKSLTHPFNNGYIEYDKFISKCREEFDEAKRKYPKVPNSLITRIEHFAFKDDPNWYIREGENRKYIKIGWSEPSFVAWYKENRRHPSYDAKYNSEMIVPFKNSIQVRTDTGNLVSLINRNADFVFGIPRCCTVEITENVKTAQFYTDVDNLGQAIVQMFSSIKEQYQLNFKEKVEIDFTLEKEFKVLTITHVGSTPTKNAKDKDYVGGNTDAIKKALQGLCNYEIMAKFPDGAFRKIILSDNYEEYRKGVVAVDESVIKGYTHVLKFY